MRRRKSRGHAGLGWVRALHLSPPVGLRRTALVPIAMAGLTAFAACGERTTHPAGGESQGDVGNAFPIDRVGSKGGGGEEVEAPSFTIGTPGSGTLVLYDRTGPWGWLGELYAMNAGVLAGHFGDWTAKPVGRYAAGEMATYTAVIYIGSTFDEPLPAAFLDDVLQDARPVVWVDSNVWQLAARAGSFAQTYGFQPWQFDASDVGEVDYKGEKLTRHVANKAGIMTYASVAGANVLAEAVRANGAKLPWALRGKHLTYVGENPFAYVTSNDRYLAFCDLLFDALAPDTPERHRALLRIEDVSAHTSPEALRAIADYLSSERVPFTIATIPMYVDPNGHYTGGAAQTMPLATTSPVVGALKYMLDRGGRLVLHGYSHQYGAKPNPYNGASEDDFEFFTAHIDSGNFVVYDGPVPEDSETWAKGRISAALDQLAAAALPAPTVFEYPHYAGSVIDSRALRSTFATVYHRGLYFGGTMKGLRPDYARSIGVMFPYVGRDVFDFKVLPENLGSYSPEPANNHAPRHVEDLVRTARANRVVRDGFASFYFHPYYDVSILKELVSRIKAEGYTFVDATAL
jgi:uncharacterized protein YdaL